MSRGRVQLTTPRSARGPPVQRLRAERDGAATQRALEALTGVAASGDGNLWHVPWCLTGVDVLLSTSVSATDYPQRDRVAS